MGRVGTRAELDVSQAYAARAVDGEIDFSGVESPSDGVFLATRPHAAAVLRRRLADLVLASDGIDRDEARPLEVLHVGSGEGALLSLVTARLEGAETTGMEPMMTWGTAANEAGVKTLDIVPELADGEQQYDLVAEHHLLHRMPEPRRHLRALAALVREGGRLVLEVPNLLHAPRPLSDGYLSAFRPHLFTARSLRTMCARAGLTVVHLDEGSELRVICTPMPRGERGPREVAPGPSSIAVFEAVRCNDLRIRLKRALAKQGPTPEIMRVGMRAHEACRWRPGRADLAIELAAALERAKRWDEAAAWLRRSLLDRKDPDVACMAIRCETVAKAMARGTRGTSVHVGPDLGERLGPVPQPRHHVN